MKRIATLGIALCFAGALAYAENLNGKLMDATCWDKSSQATPPEPGKKSQEQAEQKCAPTAATTEFVIEVSQGKVYKLDSEGNAKAMAAFRSGSLKGDKDGDIHVTIVGTPQGDSVKVESLSGGGKG